MLGGNDKRDLGLFDYFSVSFFFSPTDNCLSLSNVFQMKYFKCSRMENLLISTYVEIRS